MKFEKTSVWGFEHAARGMRNPLNSWDKSDSGCCKDINCDDCCNQRTDEDCYYAIDGFVLGKKDLDLMQRLIKAGSEQRKFLRQIFVSVDITAPLYFYKELDTYKIGTVANSTSTMHKLASTPITIDCFEIGDFNRNICNCVGYEVDRIIYQLEKLRQTYLETKDKRYWKELIRWLPNSWLQKRTITMNYENILNMYRHRKNHKLSEWSVDFIKWVESLPYAKELLTIK